jgi:hypothetical protein
MGEKATRREWKCFSELRIELDQAYREAYRQESASYN